MSGIICILLAWFLYKFAIGFTFDFERLRLRWEGMFVSGLIALFMLLFSFFLYKDDMRLYILFFPIALLFLFYYSVRREKMND